MTSRHRPLRRHHPFRRHRPLRFTPGLVLMAAMVVLSACAGEERDDHAAREASIYQIVITDLSNRTEPGADDDPDDPDNDDRHPDDGAEDDDSVQAALPVVFIDALGADPISLETQVEVVARFVDVYEIRFIDDIAEAIEVDVEGRPVREGNLLLGLGPIKFDTTAEVRGEVYLHTDDIRAFRYTFTSAPGSGGTWALAAPPEQTDAEGFPPTP